MTPENFIPPVYNNREEMSDLSTLSLSSSLKEIQCIYLLYWSGSHVQKTENQVTRKGPRYEGSSKS